ncbi:MAG: PadR family transcriptional regulator [Nitrososphaerales archaeon]
MGEESVRFCRIVTRLIDVFILSILNGKPQTGYGIRKVLKRTMNVQVSYGLLYPSLHNLEKIGYIEGRWVAQSKVETLQKKVYRLTPKGREALSAYLRYLQIIISKLQQTSTQDVKVHYRQEGLAR